MVGMWQRQRDDDYVASLDWFTVKKCRLNHGFFMFFRDFDYWIWMDLGFQQIFSGLVVSFTRLIFRL